jgi:hypothetical protein
MKKPAGTPPRGRLALLAVLLLAGCGVPADDQPRDLGRSQVAYGSDPPAPDRFGPAVERLYLVGDGGLVRVVRRTPAPRSPEQQDGLTSALAQMRVGSTSVSQRRAAVEIGAPPVPGARSDEALAYAQIVCTLTSQGAEVGTVSFTRDGQTLAVPRGDGSLSTGPLTIADYAELIRS